MPSKYFILLQLFLCVWQPHIIRSYTYDRQWAWPDRPGCSDLHEDVLWGHQAATQWRCARVFIVQRIKYFTNIIVNVKYAFRWCYFCLASLTIYKRYDIDFCFWFAFIFLPIAEKQMTSAQLKEHRGAVLDLIETYLRGEFIQPITIQTAYVL